MSAIQCTAFLLFALIVPISCSSQPGETEQRTTFVLASTTSVQDSGLLDFLIPTFERGHSNLRVKVVAVGSGEAMDLGKHGDADVLLVHSPKQEEQFLNDGFGTFRARVMKNDFVIAGPSSDPARIVGSPDAASAFRSIALARSRFLSRGDESGTHQRELDLWGMAHIDDFEDWYSQSGQGMAETLAIAEEMSAYALTDTASFRVMADRISLKVLFGSDPVLVNLYSVIPVKDARNHEAALAFADWITGELGQNAIRNFGVKNYGSSLFEPDASSK